MKEKKIIQGKKISVLAICLALLIVGIILFTIVWISETTSGFYAKEIEIAQRTGDWSYVFTSMVPYFISFTFLPFLLIAGLIFSWITPINLVVTEERIYGKVAFGKSVNISLDTVSSVRNCSMSGIEILTSSYQKIHFIMIQNRDDILGVIDKLLQQRGETPDQPIYYLGGARGRFLKVYEDKCIMITKPGAASLLTGNATDGEKTLYYTDVIGVQFKKASVSIGYLQLETASSSMNNKHNNFWNENSFTFEADLNDKMDAVAEYVKKKVEENKKQKTVASVVQTTLSPADELKKYKDLLDNGIITQEEFDAKKKQLLGL